MDAVEIADLTVNRGGRRVLRGVSCTVPAGQITGLLGPSGGGKTTLMRCVVGVQRVAGGSVRVLGRAAGSATLRRRVGYVTQAASVYADLSVRDNARFFAAVYGVGADAADGALAQVGLADRAAAPVSALSGGERARVSLACALLAVPEVLILDEPTVGLDPVLRRDLWQLFGTLATAGATLLVSSHVMDEARRCSRLLLLRDGTLIADDTPAGLRARTGTEDLDEAFLRLAEELPKEMAR
jgi:ABC-2 type transport system ATP-binding protein